MNKNSNSLPIPKRSDNSSNDCLLIRVHNRDVAVRPRTLTFHVMSIPQVHKKSFDDYMQELFSTNQGYRLLYEDCVLQGLNANDVNNGFCNYGFGSVRQAKIEYLTISRRIVDFKSNIKVKK